MEAMTSIPNQTENRSGLNSSRFRHGRFSRIIALTLVWSCACCCYGQSGQQKFTLSVAEGIGVTSPPQSDVNLELVPGSDAFPEQIWNVRSSSEAGVVVEFAIGGAFAHETLAGVKVDAGLDINVPSTTGSATWQVTQSSDSSSYASGDESAVVQVVSDGVGTAQVGLTMRFVRSSLEVIPVGEYSTIVTCTISLP